MMSRCRPTGAGSGSAPIPSSSGRDDPAGSTTESATSVAETAGESSGCRPDGAEGRRVGGVFSSVRTGLPRIRLSASPPLRLSASPPARLLKPRGNAGQDPASNHRPAIELEPLLIQQIGGAGVDPQIVVDPESCPHVDLLARRDVSLKHTGRPLVAIDQPDCPVDVEPLA